MKYNSFLPLVIVGGIGLSAMADANLESSMLSHVEKILVIDTLTVDRDAFLSRYRIQASTGNLLTGDEVAEQLGRVKFPEPFEGSPAEGFTNEYNDYMIWAQQDTTGYFRLAESVRLMDGSWDTPRFTPAVLNFGMEMPEDSAVNSNAAFPFMADDGQTLYFAAVNDKSLGGYDIFIATKDPSDGSFLIPGNMGMPFNSPFDDYMLVLDRQTGVGWWASDRNQLEDELTVYIYALADERENVDPDDENLHNYATLSGWQSLLDDEAEEMRQRYLAEINSIKKVERRSPEFELPMPGGKTYRYFTDFKVRENASLMKRYLADRDALEESERQLRQLRAQYHETGNRDLQRRILQMEQDVRKSEEALKSLLSQIYEKEQR